MAHIFGIFIVTTNSMKKMKIRNIISISRQKGHKVMPISNVKVYYATVNSIVKWYILSYSCTRFIYLHVQYWYTRAAQVVGCFGHDMMHVTSKHNVIALCILDTWLFAGSVFVCVKLTFIVINPKKNFAWKVTIAF